MVESGSHYILFSEQQGECACGAREVPVLFDTLELAQQKRDAIYKRLEEEGSTNFMILRPLATAAKKTTSDATRH